MRIFQILIALAMIVGCSNDYKTDQELLEADRKELIENLNTYKVTTYKFAKILIRSSAEQNTLSPEYQSFKSDLDRIFVKIQQYDSEGPDGLSILDYLSIYRDYKQMEDFIKETDEDIFPTLSDAFNQLYGDSASRKRALATGAEKTHVQNVEHAVLSVMALLSKDLGKEVSLYECSKTHPELLPDSELKTLLQFLRGFIFFEKGLHYLSEDEVSRNIDWLNANRHVDLPYTRTVFQWSQLSQEQTHIAFHAINHLFRGFDRLMMERAIDEERALQDFEVFLADAKEIGLENEIVWSIEIYLYLKSEENEKAVAALNQLKTSSLLSSSDRERIDESIAYVQQREPGKVLNGFYDKYFLSKLAIKYMFSLLSKVDWQRMMEAQNVPHTKEMFQTMDKLNIFLENLDKYASAEYLKEKGKAIQETGKNLWDKAKEMTE